MSVTPDALAIHALLRGSQGSGPASRDLAIRTPDRVKVVVCIMDGKRVPALLPAPLAVNLERLLNLAGAEEIRFEQDHESLGGFSTETVFVDVRLAATSTIVFATDTVEETIALPWADFARAVRPIVGDFAEPPRDRVGVHRLSYRE
jgi:hypothetical protein